MKTFALLGSLVSCLLVSAACTPETPAPTPTTLPTQSAEPTLRSSPDTDSTDFMPYGSERPNVLLIGPAVDSLEDCGSFNTQTEMNLCAKRNADASSEPLTQISTLVSDSLDPAGKTSLARSDTAWTTFRDLDCRFASDQFAGGSMESFVYGGCLTAHNLARIEELSGEATIELSYTEADRQLNEDYQALRTLLSAQRQEALTDVQLAWIEYRDRNCAYEASYSPTHTVNENQCLARMSEARALELQQSVQQNSL